VGSSGEDWGVSGGCPTELAIWDFLREFNQLVCYSLAARTPIYCFQLSQLHNCNPHHSKVCTLTKLFSFSLEVNFMFFSASLSISSEFLAMGSSGLCLVCFLREPFSFSWFVVEAFRSTFSLYYAPSLLTRVLSLFPRFEGV